MENAKYIMDIYARFPITLEKGCGMYVTDINGKRYLDFVAGIAVNALGHGNEKLAEAVSTQAKELIHCSNLYYTMPQMDFAKLLIDNSVCMEKVFFCNSGAEAVEAALKLARKYGSKCGKYEIIAMKNSFHGRTYGAVTATGQEKYHKGFEPMLPGIIHTDFNDAEALLKAVTEKTCAVILEPVQGEGGIVPADTEYLKKVKELCDEKDIALIFDEVQCGIGRLGTLFAYEHFGVYPNIAVMAKGIAGGLPMGAIAADNKFADVFKPGNHASTFGGNPLVTAAASVVVTEILKLLENVKQQGQYLRESLLKLQGKYGIIKFVRGIGLMQCIELAVPAKPLIKVCVDNGLLLVSSGENVVRFVPPLIAEKCHIDEMCFILDGALKEVCEQC